MKKRVMKKWVKALRSGEYKQASDELQNSRTNGYCCLGVLCKVAEAEGVEIKYHPDTKILEGGTLRSQTDVQEWADFKSSTGKLPDKFSSKLVDEDGVKTLASLNDHGKSFKQIANIIERYWKEL